MIVALTGGIGSGKTTVAKLFETMGCVVYNSDERAKELYNIPEVKKQVIELLGDKAYLQDDKLNKLFISDVIFKDKNKLEKPGVTGDAQTIALCKKQIQFETIYSGVGIALSTLYTVYNIIYISD